MEKTYLRIYLVAIIFGMIACNPVDPTIDTPVITVNAGADQIVDFGTAVQVNGSASVDPFEAVTYLWEIVSIPNGSTLTLDNPTSATFTFEPDQIGQYNFELTAKGESGVEGKDEVIITVEQASILLVGLEPNDRRLVNIYEDPEFPDYRVPSTYIVAAELIIDPDVKIVFEENAEFIIQDGGTLKASGEEDKPIVFTGRQAEKGFWKYILIESKNTGNAVENVIIEYANIGLLMNDAILSVDKSTIRENLSYGISIQGPQSELLSFSNNVIMSNGVPVLCRFNHFEYLNPSSDFTGNNNDYIEAYRSDDVDQDVNVPNLNAPFRLPNTKIRLNGTVTIAEGTDFISAQDGALDVTTSGKFVAVGTASEPISFKGAEDIKGYWQGIRIRSNDTGNELKYVNISNGGSQSWNAGGDIGNLTIWEEGRAKITNVTSTTSKGFGLLINHNDVILSNFQNNVFTRNDVPARMTYDQYRYMDATNSFVGNLDDYIESVQSKITINEDATWPRLDVPYRLVDNSTTIEADITIETGTTFLGISKSALIIGEEGSLKAEGTMDLPITFKGFENVRGYWRGLRFMSNSPNNILRYAVVSNGGETAWSGSKSNIRVDGRLVLEDSHISSSEGYGVFVGLEDVLIHSDNTFEDNELDDIYFQQ